MSKQQSLTDIDAKPQSKETTTTEVDSAQNDTSEPGPQIGLSDVSYEEHTAPEPPQNRVTDGSIHHDEFYESDIGDVIWVDGIEYVVVDRPSRLLSPNPLGVISEDGHQGELVAGKISQREDAADGVMWASDIEDKEDETTLSRSDLLCGYDRLARLEEKSLEHVHKWTPNTNQRDCPKCGRGGDPIRIERQASKAVELRRCVETDCKHWYRYVRNFPEPDTATIVTNDFDDDGLGVESVTGVFRAEEQDDFKLMFETNDGRDDGFYTASEIAEFVNAKMTSPDVSDLLLKADKNNERVSASELLNAIELAKPSKTNHDDQDKIPTESFGEVYKAYADKSQVTFDKDLQEELDEVTATTFFKVLSILTDVAPNQSWESNKGIDLSKYQFDPRSIEILSRGWGEGKIKTVEDPASLIAADYIDYHDTSNQSKVIEEARAAVTEMLFNETSVTAPQVEDNEGDLVTKILTELLQETSSDSITGPAWLIQEVETRLDQSVDVPDVISHKAFERLLNDYSTSSLFGGVTVNRNRNGRLEVEWRDAKGFNKKMRITFTRIEDNLINTSSFKWNAERHDLSEIAP